MWAHEKAKYIELAVQMVFLSRPRVSALKGPKIAEKRVKHLIFARPKEKGQKGKSAE